VAVKAGQKRKGVDASPSRVVKTTVSLDVGTLAKLAACAALRGSSQSALAAAFIRDGLKGVVAFDKSMSSVSADSKGRLTEANELSLDAEEEAA
jgi:hypothetical protein